MELEQQQNKQPSWEMGKGSEQAFFNRENKVPGNTSHQRNEIKTSLRHHFMLVRMAIIQISKNNKHWWGCRQKQTNNSSKNTVGRTVKWHDPYGRQYGNSSETENTWPSYPAPGIYPKGMKVVYEESPTRPRLQQLKIWKQPGHPPTDEWIKKCTLNTQWTIIQP